MLKKLIQSIWPYLILIVLGVCFFGYFLKGSKVLLPADLLVGAYYPWRENKWGYEVAVPYKNPLLSDSYSQFYIWKKLIADSYKQGEWPLWNQYSYSGYPLAANLHSAAFYPFNILFVYLPFNQAWNWYLILGSILSSLAMYSLIRVFGMSKGAGIVGGLIYGYCGYAITWMEFATTTNSMIWIPLLVLVIEKYFQSKSINYLPWISVLTFLLITSGNFQMSIYGAIVVSSYSIFRIRKNLKAWINIFLFGFLGVLISSIALFPGFEMLSLSIRNIENSIKGINYGLVPLSHLITIVAPDFFGNPATGNYWGFLNYHETLIYGGVVVFLSILWSVINFNKLPKFGKYFLILILISLFFYIDNPIIKFGYSLNIPGLSTTTAGRNAFFWILGGSILSGIFVDNFYKTKILEKIKIFAYCLLFLVIVGLIVFIVKKYYLSLDNPVLLGDIANLTVSMRNLIVPIFLLIGFGTIAIVFSKWKYWWILLILLVMADSLRFTKKYLPISESKYVFPQTEITDYLMKDKGIFRVEKEKGALLSPNTWTMYGLQSPSGYDPMATAIYVEKFNREINGGVNGFSRYAEIEKYDAKILGNFNVKYLLAFKNNVVNENTNSDLKVNIIARDWKRVFETNIIVILENKKFTERFRIIDQLGNDIGEIKTFDYKNNKIDISYQSNENGYLVITDSWYPGWKVWINGKENKIEKYNEIFRKVTLTKGSGTVEMKYEPMSFYMGKIVSFISIGVWFFIAIVLKFRKNKRLVSKLQ